MTQHFTQYLMEIGYKPFRFVRGVLIGDSGKLDFSTMRDGGLDIRFMKGDSCFIFGLHEFGKPPTLIYPRKDIETDDKMNEFLNSNENEYIYNYLKL